MEWVELQYFDHYTISFYTYLLHRFSKHRYNLQCSDTVDSSGWEWKMAHNNH